jgi:hypothetical protein
MTRDRTIFNRRRPLTDGVDTHRNIQNTTRYTALAPDRFKGFWKD